MPVHLIKLAVGVRDVDHIRDLQSRRLQTRGDGVPVVPVHTRNVPKRGAEACDGGSLYWVIRGSVAVRQRLIAVEATRNAEGEPACILWLDPGLVETVPAAHRPFQGWRYLEPAAAPPDLAGAGGGDLPPDMAAELRALGLL